MAQGRSSRRGVANVVTCAVLMLFGMLAFAAGCSSVDGASSEEIGSASEAQLGCTCPADNPCATFTCTSLGQCRATVLIKEGEVCGSKLTGLKGLCHLNLCCPGCVVPGGKGAPPSCAPRDGAADTQCGETGLTCENCLNDSCQRGSCEAKACVRKPVPEGEPCVNTSGACHNGSCCQGCVDANDACAPGGALDACGASSDKLVKCRNCVDDKACTAEACVNGACEYPASPSGTGCGDGNICNGDEACSGTSCEPGKALDCDDGESCTKDSCGPNGCIHEALTNNACSDGDPCTTGDKCGSDGKCQKGTPIKCDDGEFCTTDSCENGNCVNKPKANTVTCDDGNTCTAADKCTDGKCKGTNPNIDFSCDDGNPCTVDFQPDCSVKQCTHTPTTDATIACAASDACHANGHCSGTDDKCVAGAAKDCADTSPCTKDTCDPVSGCVNTNDASADCSDGDPCTENDVCVAGNCGGKPKKCLALDACHEAGTCNETTGKCDDPRADDGTACPGGSCENGTCILDPNAGLGGEGAGGAAGGAGAEGGADTGIITGGAPAAPQGEAGEAQTPGSGDAGAPTAAEPERPFVRTPGGCSCEVPDAGGHERPVALLGLAFLAAALRRRSRGGRLAA